MLQAMLEIFTTEQKAADMLANPIIEFIFMTLFIMFIMTMFIHFILYLRLKNIRNHVQNTGRLDVEPLQSFKDMFDNQQKNESINIETFVQERFSSWRMLNMPVVNLIKLVQMTVSIFILLGVLGTFIGLTISLGSINTGSDQLVENVATVLSGIDVAFYTSIIGMGFSLIMTVVVKLFNTEHILTDIMLTTESHLKGDEQHGMSRLITVSETINESVLALQKTHEQSLQGIVNAFAGFKDYTEGLKQSAQDLKSFNDGLSHNLDNFQELFQQMKTVTDGFSDGTTKLNENFETLFDYFKKADRKNERIVTTFEKTHASIQSVSQAQINNFTEFTGTVDSLKTFTHDLLADQTVMHESLAGITEKNSELTEIMATHNKTFKDIFGGNLSGELRHIGTYLNELSKDFDQLGHAIVSLPQALEVINETQTTYKHLLSDRFRELKEFNQSFSNHLKDHAGESAAFERQMREATSTYEQMSMKNNQLIAEMNTTLGQMGQSFSQRENVVETSVAVLKDTLTKYITHFEGQVGNKLEQVVRQIGDSLDMTTEGIKRELMEIRRMNDDIQQNHSRSMQQLLQDVGREIHTLNRNLANVQKPVPVNNRIGWNDNES